MLAQRTVVFLVGFQQSAKGYGTWRLEERGTHICRLARPGSPLPPGLDVSRLLGTMRLDRTISGKMTRMTAVETQVAFAATGPFSFTEVWAVACSLCRLICRWWMLRALSIFRGALP